MTTTGSHLPDNASGSAGNPGDLGFRATALPSFRFLRRYGFRLVGERAVSLRFESPRLFFVVYHDSASGQLGAEVGEIGRPERWTAEHMVQLAGKSAWEEERFGRCAMFQTRTGEGVRVLLPKLAAIVERYGEPFLSGGESFYAARRLASERARAAFERRQGVDRARARAEAAWAARDYVQVARLLAPFREDLPRVDAARLAYSERRSGRHRSSE